MHQVPLAQAFALGAVIALRHGHTFTAPTYQERELIAAWRGTER